MVIPPSWRRTGKMASPTGGLAPTTASPMWGEVIAQHPADGTVRDHLHRSRHHLSLAVGRDREHSQRVHLGLDRQAAVLSDLQISRHVHQRFGGNRVAFPIVKVEDGPDGRDGHMKGGGRGTARLGFHIHEHQIRGGAVPVGEMRKVQGRLPATASPIHRKQRQGRKDAVAGIHLQRRWR